MSRFFAYLARMRHIRRWGLMRNTHEENIQEHSLQVAHIAHALAILRNVRYGGGADPARAAELAVFHETAEVITGDLPTPIKYYNDDIRKAYKHIEDIAAQRMIAMLPEDLQKAYTPVVIHPQDDPEWPRVKAADKICAYLKCLEEERAGNREFEHAKETIYKDLEQSPLPEVQDFLREFIPSFTLTLDELNK